MRRAGYSLGLWVWALLLAGCMNSRIHVPYEPGGEGMLRTVASRADNPFEYKRDIIHPGNSVLSADETDTYRVRQLSFPSMGENGQDGNLVTARYYQSKLPGRKKLVMVLPIWASYTYPSRVISEGVLERSRGDTNVMMILGEKDLIDWPALREAPDESTFLNLMKRMAERLRTTVIDIRRLVDWAETQPDIDSRRIGVIGFSIGAMVAGAALVGEPRIAAGVLVMGGANPHEIFANCQWEPGAVRESALKRFGWTKDRYQAVLQSIFAPVNPARFPGAVDPRRVIIFDSYYDTCIPESSRQALWNAMGRPERISFLYDHRWSFLSMTPLGLNYMRREIYQFLGKTLQMGQSKSAAGYAAK